MIGGAADQPRVARSGRTVDRGPVQDFGRKQPSQPSQPSQARRIAKNLGGRLGARRPRDSRLQASSAVKCVRDSSSPDSPASASASLFSFVSSVKMVFYPPDWSPKLANDPPDSISLFDFVFDEKYGRRALKDSRPFFTCGLSGESYTPLEVKERVEYLARGLAEELGWQPNEGTEWDKVIGVFSANTVSITSRITHHASRITNNAFLHGSS
jgi:hypothetical protein